ncbi:MAG TPA: ASPIC/UnbV domain-containing protein [Verrucomicrobiales bacterium]|nr:ASPIC/UnbV domain-containing protein [Verrucomicrobiales bacterium]
MRTDENLSRESFRKSSEWKRTAGSSVLTPEIDARLAGVEKRGDQLVVHSLSGGERDHYFSNRGGKAFTDLSALSGLDNPSDGRGFAVLDYDRDGWQDIAMVSADKVLFNLYHNEIPDSGTAVRDGFIALSFVGGNRSDKPSKEFTSRDGYGAKVTVTLNDMTIIREHRCGDGFAAQHTATMIVGIGNRPAAKNIAVRWPSGKTVETGPVPAGTLLTCYEKALEVPYKGAGPHFQRTPYRLKLPSRPNQSSERPSSPFASADTGARPETKVRVYTSMATWCPSCAKHLPQQKRLAAQISSDAVELIAVPIDEKEDPAKLQAYAEKTHPPYRLLSTLPSSSRAAFTAELTTLLGHEPGLPSSLITDSSGRILDALPGLPTVSQLRRWLADNKQ